MREKKEVAHPLAEDRKILVTLDSRPEQHHFSVDIQELYFALGPNGGVHIEFANEEAARIFYNLAEHVVDIAELLPDEENV